MKILDKLALFKRNALQDITQLDNSELLKLQMTPRFLESCLFELAAQLNSPVISKADRIFLGAHSYINDGGYLRGNTLVGRFCSVGRRVSIGAGIHEMNGVSTSSSVQRGTARPYTEAELSQLGIRKIDRQFTVVMNDVWVGDGAIILPGVTVHTGSVIGANAVVTRDIPSYAVVGGCPAKIIRYRFPESVIEALIKSEWWELSKSGLSTLPTGNVFEFIEAIGQGKGSNSIFRYHSFSLKKNVP